MQREERDDRAEGQDIALDGQQGADHRQEHVAEFRDIAVDGHNHVGYLVGVEDAPAKLLIEAGKGRLRLLLVAEDLHHPLPGNHLLDEAVDLPEALLALGEILLRPLPQQARHPVHKGRHHDGDARERQAQHHHTDKGGGNGDQRFEQIGNAVADDLPERVDVVGVDRHNVAVTVRIEVAERKALHPGEGLGTEAFHRALPDKDHQEGLHIAGDDADQQDGAELP